MVKPVLSGLTFLTLITLSLSGEGCSTARREAGRPEDLPFSKSSGPVLAPKTAWRHKIDGRLTELSVADSSGEVLISEVLEGISENKTRVSLLSPSGKKIWSTSLNSPVRSQAISRTGDRILISTYQEELIRLDSKTGITLWAAPDTGMCRPYILEKSDRILCHHDDDASPGLVFEAYSSEGKKLWKQTDSTDSLLIKVSKDESKIVIGFVKGKLQALDTHFKLLWEKRLEGEIVDAAVSSGPSQEGMIDVAVLVNTSHSGQSLLTLSKKGRVTQEVKQNLPLQQVEVSEDGQWLSVYGNGPRGQLIAQYDAEPRLQERWSYHYPKYADYNLKMDILKDWTLLGFENVAQRTRFSHVLALDRAGSMELHIPIVAEEGAYLYARGTSRSPGMIVLGTDDGQISAYQLQPSLLTRP